MLNKLDTMHLHIEMRSKTIAVGREWEEIKDFADIMYHDISAEENLDITTLAKRAVKAYHEQTMPCLYSKN